MGTLIKTGTARFFLILCHRRLTSTAKELRQVFLRYPEAAITHRDRTQTEERKVWVSNAPSGL